MRSWLFKAACSFGFLGYLPRFPGTWGTLGAMAVYLGVVALDPAGPFLFWGIPVAVLAVSVLAVPLGSRAETVFQGKDPRQFVLDEVAGYFVSLLFLAQYSVWAGGLAFLVFRFFDIVKPWPIRKAEGLRGGWGILMDDLLAGLLTNQIVRLACFLISFP